MDDDTFLDKYYGIRSLNDVLVWYENNKSTSYLTVKRLLNCALNIFKDDINIVDDRLINILLFILKKEWLQDIYKKFKNNVVINNGSIRFSNKKHNTDGIHSKEIINFLLSKVNNNNIISSFLDHYMKTVDKWNNVNNHVDNMKKVFIEYIKK